MPGHAVIALLVLVAAVEMAAAVPLVWVVCLTQVSFLRQCRPEMVGQAAIRDPVEQPAEFVFACSRSRILWKARNVSCRMSSASEQDPLQVRRDEDEQNGAEPFVDRSEGGRSFR